MLFPDEPGTTATGLGLSFIVRSPDPRHLPWKMPQTWLARLVRPERQSLQYGALALVARVKANSLNGKARLAAGPCCAGHATRP